MSLPGTHSATVFNIPVGFLFILKLSKTAELQFRRIYAPIGISVWLRYQIIELQSCKAEDAHKFRFLDILINFDSTKFGVSIIGTRETLVVRRGVTINQILKPNGL